MTLRVSRKDGEGWRDCVVRYAAPHDLVADALASFDCAVAAGQEESAAAFEAICEWDLCDYVEDPLRGVAPTLRDAFETADPRLESKTFSGTPLGKCPCGGDIGIGFTDNRADAMIHSLPICQKYLELDALDFAKYVNAMRGMC